MNIVYIIGGASVYRQALSLADELCLTEIDDVQLLKPMPIFPEVSPNIWHEKSREAHPVDEKHLCPYAFVDYVNTRTYPTRVRLIFIFMSTIIGICRLMASWKEINVSVRANPNGCNLS